MCTSAEEIERHMSLCLRRNAPAQERRPPHPVDWSWLAELELINAHQMTRSFVMYTRTIYMLRRIPSIRCVRSRWRGGVNDPRDDFGWPIYTSLPSITI